MLDDIPLELYAKLQTLKPILLEQGAIVSRQYQNRISFRLRFRDPTEGEPRRHRSLELGPPLVAKAVEELINSWRTAGAKPRTSEAEKEESLRAHLLYQLEKATTRFLARCSREPRGGRLVRRVGKCALW